MKLAHVIALDPTAKQQAAFICAVGVHRFAYNWVLAEYKQQRAAGKKPNANDLKKQFNSIKREQFPWIMDSLRDANSQPFADFNTALRNFFKSIKGERKGPKIG